MNSKFLALSSFYVSLTLFIPALAQSKTVKQPVQKSWLTQLEEDFVTNLLREEIVTQEEEISYEDEIGITLYEEDVEIEEETEWSPDRPHRVRRGDHPFFVDASVGMAPAESRSSLFKDDVVTLLARAGYDGIRPSVYNIFYLFRIQAESEFRTDKKFFKDGPSKYRVQMYVLGLDGATGVEDGDNPTHIGLWFGKFETTRDLFLDQNFGMEFNVIGGQLAMEFGIAGNRRLNAFIDVAATLIGNRHRETIEGKSFNPLKFAGGSVGGGLRLKVTDSISTTASIYADGDLVTSGDNEYGYHPKFQIDWKDTASLGLDYIHRGTRADIHPDFRDGYNQVRAYVRARPGVLFGK